MQTVAEEKRKAYRCVCWSAKKIDADMLKVNILIQFLTVSPHVIFIYLSFFAKAGHSTSNTLAYFF